LSSSLSRVGCLFCDTLEVLAAAAAFTVRAHTRLPSAFPAGPRLARHPRLGTLLGRSAQPSQPPSRQSGQLATRREQPTQRQQQHLPQAPLHLPVAPPLALSLCRWALCAVRWLGSAHKLQFAAPQLALMAELAVHTFLPEWATGKVDSPAVAAMGALGLLAVRMVHAPSFDWLTAPGALLFNMRTAGDWPGHTSA
jgi:hypothetical protein